MTKRIKLGLYAFITAMLLFVAGVFMMPTKTAKAEGNTMVTITAIGGYQVNVDLNGQGTYGNTINLATDVNGSSTTWTFFNDSSNQMTYNGANQYSDICWAGTKNLYIQSYFTVEENGVIILPKGMTFTIAGETFELSQGYKMTYAGGVLSGETIVENANTMVTITGVGAADATYGTINFVTDIAGATTWKFCNTFPFEYNGEEKQIPFGWIAANVMQTQGFTGWTEGDVLTIKAGTTFSVNSVNTVYEITNNYTIYYYDGAWNTTEKPEPVENIKVTITWAGAENATYKTINLEANNGSSTYEWVDGTVLYNGTETAVRFVWANATTLQIATPNNTWANGDTIIIAEGSIFTTSEATYEFASGYKITYNGAWSGEAYTEPVANTLVTVTGLGAADATNKTINFVATNGSSTYEWADGVALYNDTETAVRFVWATSEVLQIATASNTWAEGDVLTIKAATTFTSAGIVYEFASDYTIYYYNSTWNTIPAPTKVTLTALRTESAVTDRGDGTYLYQLYLDTDITVPAYYPGWDNAASILVNGTDAYAGDTTWDRANESGKSILYLQDVISTDVTVDTITLKAGTKYSIGGIEYEITADFVVYNYDGDLHSEAKPQNTYVTITGLGAASEGTINFVTDIDGATAWNFCDTFPFEYNSETLAKPFGWVGAGVAQAILTNITWTEGDVLTIKAGTTFSVNTVDTIYEIASDYTVYYYNNTWNETFAYKVTRTIGAETVSEYVSGAYTLPEFAINGYMSLGWKVNGSLYEMGDTLAQTATVAGYSIEAVYVDFTQVDGASVKIGSALSGSGIRFTARLAEKNEYIVYMGVLVMPVDLMTKGDFTHDNYIEDDDYLEFFVYSEDMEIGTFQDNGEAYYLNGSVVKLFEANYNRTFAGRSFLAVNYVDGEKYVYVDYDESVHERRICDVAKAALEDTTKTYTQSQKDVLVSYAKNADTLISYAYYGPTSTDKYAEYAGLDMDVLWLDSVSYRYHSRYGAITEAEELYNYNNPSHTSFDLKGAFEIAREQDLKVIVFDIGLRRLSESDIPLIATDPANPQLLGLWLQTGEAVTAEVHGSSIDESKFDEANMTYAYSSSNFAGTGKAKVLNYVYQFASEEALKEYVAAFMSAYAQEPNFYGVMLADEPSVAVFPQLALMEKVIAELYPKAYTQTCQLPAYAYSSYTEWKNAISSYVAQNDYIGEIGVDFYPFLVENGSWWDQIFGGEDGVTIRSNYLASMQYLAQIANEYDIDFEHTLQAHALEDAYSAVSASQLALQVHLGLAFGADRIAYYSYNTDASAMTQYINSDATLAAAVKDANKDGDYLKKNMTFFEYKQTKLYGKSSDCLDTSNLTVASALTNEIISSASNSLLVNEFYNEMTGEYGYYIVNITDPTNNKTVTVSLTEAMTVYQNQTTSSTSSITLGAGEGVFIVK